MIDTVLTLFRGGIGKLWPYIGVFAGGMAVWAGLKASGRKEGRQEVINKVNNETSKIKDKWAEIDSRAPSYDDALDSLRSKQRNDN